MKTQARLTALETLILLTTLLLFASLPARAQTYQNASLSLPFTTITAGGNSNVTVTGNASGYTPATPYNLVSPRTDVPWQLALTFSCPTVTLAVAHVTLGYSLDGTNFGNTPGEVGTYLIKASASSAWTTNGTLIISSTDTNVFGRPMPRLPYVTLLGVSNGNAATLTLGTATVRELR